MNHVYLVLAHKNPRQVYRLIERLSYADTQFVIHIDATADLYSFTNIIGNGRQDIIFLEERYRTTWGSFAIVEATLHGLKFIKKHLPQTARVTLLSGQDYPIKPVKQINSYFQAHVDSIFLDHFSIPARTWTNGGIGRFPNYERVSKIMKLYGGSQWWSFPMFAIDVILSILNDYPHYIDYFRLTGVPDESFFQTLLLNSEEEIVLNNIVNTNLKFVFWDLPYLQPRIFLSKDLLLLSASKDMFARKFDEHLDEEILSKIDLHLLDEKRLQAYKKNSKREEPEVKYVIAMLTNSSGALPGYYKLKADIPDWYQSWLLFHSNKGNAGDELPVQNIFKFDNSILHNLGFVPIETSLLPGSNHFPLLSFYRQYPNFDYYWLIEDDVYFNGSWRTFLEAFSDEHVRADFISCGLRTMQRDPYWYWWYTLKNAYSNDAGSKFIQIASFNPIYRISNKALSFLNEQLLSGWTGHHEVLMATLLYNAGYTILDFGGGDFGFPENLNKFYTGGNNNSLDPGYGSMRFRPLIKPDEIKGTLLYHPVKPVKGNSDISL